MAGLLTEKKPAQTNRVMGFLSDEYEKAKKAFSLIGGIPKTFKNNPRNAETMDAIFGLGGIVPGIGDAVSAAEAKYRYDQGDMLGAGLAGVGALPLVPSMAGMFIGKGAKTWDVVKASEAMQMEKAGKPPREIWAQTGNWKGPDGQWRQEIPDDKMNLALPAKEWVTQRDGKYMAPNVSGAWDVIRNNTVPQAPVRAGRFFSHQELKNAYPYQWTNNTDKQSILDMPVQLLPEGGSSSGSFTGDTLLINEALTPDAAKSTTLHELQHAIQQREGWASGGSPEEMARLGKQAQDEYDLLWQTMQSNPQNRDKIIPELDALRSRYRDFASPNDAYRRLAGEAEARATQARMNMDMPQRLATFPEDSYDVPMDQLIVRYGDGPAMAINPSEYGLPVNPDGTVSLLHGTTKDAANKIIGENRLRSAGEPSVYLTNAKDAGYGDGTLVQVDVDPRKLFLDDEFPGGRFDFSMPVRNGVANVKNARMYGDGPSMSTSRPVNHLGQPIPPTQYELAHMEAQRNAALPVEQGGLGLPEGNTAMDRAKAMGHEIGWAHGSPYPTITELRSSRIGAEGPGAYATNYLPESNTYAQLEPGATVYPVTVNRSKTLNAGAANPYELLGVEDDPALIAKLLENGNDSIIKTQEATPQWLINAGGLPMPAREHYVSTKPENFRSRFAAFDPMKRDSADLLAGVYPWAVPLSAGLLGSMFLLPNDAEAQ